jgi:hypothetical protein
MGWLGLSKGDTYLPSSKINERVQSPSRTNLWQQLGDVSFVKVGQQ